MKLKLKLQDYLFKIAWNYAPINIFRWLVKKHWIFPEPQVFSNSKYISDLMLMKNDKYFIAEVMALLSDDCSRTILEVYRKHGYFLFEPIEVSTRRNFENNSIEIRYKCVLKYTYSVGLNNVIFLSEQLRKFSQFNPL